MKKVYPTILFKVRKSYTIRTKKEWRVTTMCGLSTAQCSNNQGYIPLTTYIRATRSDQWSKVVHQVRLEGRILPYMDQRRRRMENNLQNTIWAVRIPSTTHGINECTSYIPTTNQPSPTSQTGFHGNGLPR